MRATQAYTFVATHQTAHDIAVCCAAWQREQEAGHYDLASLAPVKERGEAGREKLMNGEENLGPADNIMKHYLPWKSVPHQRLWEAFSLPSSFRDP